MGFNKRLITKESIIHTNDRDLKNLFQADAIVFDDWASRFYGFYQMGMDKDEILKIMKDRYGFDFYH